MLKIQLFHIAQHNFTKLGELHAGSISESVSEVNVCCLKKRVEFYINKCPALFWKENFQGIYVC